MPVVHHKNIPSELKSLDQWVLWRYVTRNGKPTKVPFDATTFGLAKPNDPSTWSTYETAVQSLQANIAKFDGIGLMFREHGGLVGVDLDDCINDDGKLSVLAAEIVEKFATYTEISPSGKGLKLFCQGKLQITGTGVRNVKLGVEVYQRGRYFTVTGQSWPGTPNTLADRGPELFDLLEKIQPAVRRRAKPAQLVNVRAVLSATDEDILRRAMSATNGDKLRRLYSGDTSEYATADNDGHSEADLALVSKLAFWTGPDAARLDSLFRGSGLMRPKWDERHFSDGKTYGEATIDRALDSAQNFYNRKSGEMIVALSNNSLSTINPTDVPSILNPYGRTELANARRFVAKHGADIHWCEPWTSWLVFDGKRWAIDRGLIVQSMAKCVGELLRAEFAEGAAGLDMNKGNECLRFIKSSESLRGMAAILAVARSEPGIAILPEDFDRQPWLLNVSNGTLDLRDGTLRPHRRDDLITQLCPVEYDPAAKCPTWLGFLQSILDHDSIAYLRRAIGYSLIGRTIEHVLFLVYGNGSNGKSTFTGAIEHMLGPDYSMTAAPHLLMQKRNEPHPTERADLFKKRFVSCMEIDGGQRLAESLVKGLTGGDPIRARKMRQDFEQFDPSHTTWLTMNHKPEIHGADDGIWRRIKLIEFKRRIADEAQDKNLPEKLKEESPGILAWAVGGCLEYQRGGLAEPVTVTVATTSYREEMDIVGTFLSECCTIDGTASIKAGDLYAAYVTWCERSKQTPMNLTQFGTSGAMRRLNKRTSNGVRYQGLRLRSSAE